jgi:hypothetical protein
MSSSCAQSDLVNSRAAWLIGGIPAALLVIGIGVGPFMRTLLWTPALLVAGTGCVLNAARCHRLHCYITGPLFPLGAFATVRGLEVLRIDVVAGTAAAYGLEHVRGRYVDGTTTFGRSAP